MFNSLQQEFSLSLIAISQLVLLTLILTKMQINIATTSSKIVTKGKDEL